jgi:PAS domain S-box-containing protein
MMPAKNRKNHLRSISDLEPGDHLCCLYETAAERRSLLVSFIRQGIERGEKILYIQTGDEDDDEIWSHLSAQGIDIQALFDSGALDTASLDETYLKDGSFDPDRMIAKLQAETDRALGEGYPALRLTGGTNWAQKDHLNSGLLLDYEAKLNDFFPHNPCLALCQYSRHGFDPQTLLNVLVSHPVVLIGTELYDNIYHVPPADIATQDLPRATLDYWIDNLERRKRAEQAQRTSEAYLTSLLEIASDAIIMLDQSQHIVSFNRGAERIFGYRSDEMTDQSIERLIPSRFVEPHRQKVKAFEAALQSARPMGERGEVYALRQDGSQFPAEASVSKLSQNGELFFTVILRDISHRKRVEDALRRQAQIIDQTHDAVVSTDLDGFVTSWNRGAERLFGYPLDEALGRHIAFVYPEKHHGFLQEEVIAPLKRKGAHEIQVRMVNKRGREFDAHLSLSLLRDDQGQPAGMIGYSLDISHRVKVEQELRLRARMQAIVADLGKQALSGESLPALMDEIVVQVAETLNVEFSKILELLPDGNHLLLRAGVGWKEDYVGKALVNAKTKSQAGYTLLSSEPVIVEDLRSEARFQGPPLLTDHHVTSGISVIIHGRDHPFGILGAHTTRKRTFTHDDINFLQSVANLLAEAIERDETEKRFRQLSENIREVFWMTDVQGKEILYVSPAYEQIWGRTRQSVYLRAESWQEAIHPSDREAVEAAFVPEKLARGEFDVEFRITKPDGSMRWIRDRGFPIFNEQGEVYRIAGIAEDITGRVQAEEMIRQHAERVEVLREIDQAILAAEDLETIAQVALSHLGNIVAFERASIVIFDLEASQGTILTTYPRHQGALRSGDKMPLEIFGDIHKLRAGEAYFAEDIQSLEHTSPALQALRAIGIRSYISVPLITHNELVGVLNLGSRHSDALPHEAIQMGREVANSLALAIQQNQLINRVHAGREELRRLSQRVVTIQEEERRRVSRELHDEASQALMALKLGLDGVQKDLAGQPESLTQNLQEAMDLTDSTMEKIRLLAHGLHPPELDAFGLDPVLEDYCREFALRTRIPVDYRGTELLGLPDEVSITFYRVLQEALTNVLKHSEASQVRVALVYEDGEIALSVSDDGRGFRLAADPLLQSQRGIGIIGMRERLEILNGRLKIESRPGQGTRVTAYLPWKREP